MKLKLTYIFLIIPFLLLRQKKVTKDFAKVSLLENILARFPFVRDVGSKYNVPVSIICSIIAVESSGNENATGQVGEIGLMQLTLSAVEDVNKRFNEHFTIFDIGNPLSNVRAGTLYLKLLYNETGSWENAIKAYNAGASNISAGNSYYQKVNSYIQQFKYVKG